MANVDVNLGQPRQSMANVVPRRQSTLQTWLRTVAGWNVRIKIGAVMTLLFVLFGVVLPFFSTSNPATWNLLPSDLLPSSQYILGTTDLGQDTFWLLAYSVRNSLLIGVVVATLSTVVGVAAGLVAGFYGRWLDRVLTLLMDAFIVIPSLPILILVASLLQGKGSLLVIALVLSVFNWPWPGRQTRAMTFSLREREFVNTAWYSGQKMWKIILLEIFPYIRTWAMTNFVNTVLVAVGAEAGLAILGLSSMQVPTLGTTIYWAMNHEALLRGFWFWVGSPVVAIMVMFFGLFLLSSGIAQYSTKVRGR
jgi:peptide/nickel transport system permease protein